VSPDHDDNDGRADGQLADCACTRRRRPRPPTAWPRGRRRSRVLAIADAFHYASDLSLLRALVRALEGATRAEAQHATGGFPCLKARRSQLPYHGVLAR